VTIKKRGAIEDELRGSGRSNAVAPKDDPRKHIVMAGHVLKPSLNAAAVLSEYTKLFGDRDMAGFVGALDEQMTAVKGGQMGQLDEMLLAQAYSLQAIFMNLARRALQQQNLKSWEVIMRMAFKAQNQGRMTMETLAAIKNPPVLFARQANFAQGPQQINNGAPAPMGNTTRARKSRSRQNRLMEVKDGERMEPRAPAAPSGVDPELATMVKVNRAAER